MAEVYSIGAAALAAGKELGATIESAAEKRDKAFQDFDVKYNLTSTMEETVSDTLQPVYKEAAQAALNEAQEAATALEADPNNADLRARVRAAQRQYDEIKNIGVARTAQDNKTRQMIRNGEIEDMAGSIEENLAKMDEMSSMSGKTITMEGGTVMITNPDGSKTPMLGSAYGDVQGVFTPAVMSPASKYNPSLVGTKMNYKKYKLTDGDGTIGMDMDALRAGFSEDLDVIRRANPEAYRTAVAQNYLINTTGRTDISKQELDAEIARIEPLIESTTFTIDGKQVAATTYSLDENGQVVYDLSDTDIDNLFRDGAISKDDMENLKHYRQANAMYVGDTYAAEANSIDLTAEIQQREQRKLARSRQLYDTEKAYERAVEKAKLTNDPAGGAYDMSFVREGDGLSLPVPEGAKVAFTQKIVNMLPDTGGLLGVADGTELDILSLKFDSNGKVVGMEVPDPSGLEGSLTLDVDYIAEQLAGDGDKSQHMAKAQSIFAEIKTAFNNSGANRSRGLTLNNVQTAAASALGNPPSQSDSSGTINLSGHSEPPQNNPTRE